MSADLPSRRLVRRHLSFNVRAAEVRAGRARTTSNDDGVRRHARPGGVSVIARQVLGNSSRQLPQSLCQAARPRRREIRDPGKSREDRLNKHSNPPLGVWSDRLCARPRTRLETTRGVSHRDAHAARQAKRRVPWPCTPACLRRSCRLEHHPSRTRRPLRSFGRILRRRYSERGHLLP